MSNFSLGVRNHSLLLIVHLVLNKSLAHRSTVVLRWLNDNVPDMPHVQIANLEGLQRSGLDLTIGAYEVPVAVARCAGAALR